MRLILDRFSGRWHIMEYLRNPQAVAFWRRVVSAYTAGRYQERSQSGELHQYFESGARRALYADLKPMRLWLPSQYGLLAEAPQRHSHVSVVRLIVRPVPLTSSSAPLTLSGPSS